jgi:hypothetical protein
MVVILIDSETGTRRKILVPLKDRPRQVAQAAVLTHPRFGFRA